MRNTLSFLVIVLFCCLSCLQPIAQKTYSAANGHSHNDYNQTIPFLQAYYAGMGSIEADVFLRNGKLMVAHEQGAISPLNTLDKLYLQPIADLFAKRQGSVYGDTSRALQLLIDIKEEYVDVIPELIKELNRYPGVFDPSVNRAAVRVVLSGNTPDASQYADYPQHIFFDGRPGIRYTAAQAARLGMISAALDDYSVWNGKGTPTNDDLRKLSALVNDAHAMHVPFRFWATKDSPNAWIELEKMGVDWIGTDHPEALSQFFAKRTSLEFHNPAPYDIYHPSHRGDGSHGKIKNVILLIGDGMGLAQIQGGLTTNYGNLNLAMFRFIGLSRTEASNSDITDSAAGGTAMACGEKTNNRFIGMDSAGHPIPSLADKLSAKGLKIGVISSGDITDATPAVFYAHQPDRDRSDAIAADFLNSHVDILVGPNRKAFTANSDRQLMDKLSRKGYQLTTTLDGYRKSGAEKQLVLLDDSVCRPVIQGRGNMLIASLAETIKRFATNTSGFFIMAEGAQIDYGGHSNNLPYALTELHDFDRAVGEALRFADTNGQTLVIVTADHETGGLTFQDADYRQGSIRGNFSTDDHTNIMVPVFAYGPGAELFSGVYSNTEIHHRILKALAR